MKYQWIKGLITVLVILGLFGCRGVDTNDGQGDGQGELTVRILDGPIETARAVNVTITGVQIKPEGEAPIEVTLDTALELDLLSLQDGESEELLDDHLLPVGDYRSVALLLDEAASTIQFDNDNMYPLPIRDGTEDGLQMNVNFSVEDDSEFDFTVDFDLRKSVVEIEGASPREFEMLPSLRVVETDRAATVSGTVSEALVTDSDCEENTISQGRAVYMFDGAGADIQDLRNDAGDPVATATVEHNISDDVYEYTLYVIEPGTYTLAFTCDAVLDRLEEDNFTSMVFSEAEEVTVESGDSGSVDFN